MNIEIGKIYVILDIHPRDAFFEFRRELVGQFVKLTYVSPSKIEEGDYVYCHADFLETVNAENILLSQAVFHSVALGEPNDYVKTEAREEREDQETQESVREKKDREVPRPPVPTDHS